MKRGICILLIILLMPLSISIQNHPPTTVLVYPTEGSVIKDSNPKFEWIVYDDDNDQQKEYWIQISKKEDMVNSMGENIIGPQKYTILRLEDERTYYWRVRTFDGVDWGQWSKIGNFNLDLTKNMCNDGTEYWGCNSNLQYCYGGDLINNCVYCGCKDGYKCNDAAMDAECIPLKCDDGTLYGKCNSKLQYCTKGELIENCNKCNCSEGLSCQESGNCIKKEAKIVIEEPKLTFFQKLISLFKKIFAF